MVRISLTIHPGSSNRGLQVRDDGVHLYTTAKPVEGKANRDALDILAGVFNVPKSCVSLFRGDKSKKKVFQIDAEKSRLLNSTDPAFMDSIKQYVREV